MSISLSGRMARACSLLLLSAPLVGLGPLACSSATGDPADPSPGNSGGSTGKTGGSTGNSATGGSSAGTGGSSGTGTGGGSGTGSGGNSGTGGSGSGGVGSSSGGSTGSTGSGGSSTSDAGNPGGPAVPGAKFSFFVASMEAMIRLSKSDKGFGGDLRYGQADGVSGADKICTEIADFAVPGSGAKVWHAFLSAAKGPGGTPVNAIDRVGNGPWYDRKGRAFAMTKADLIADPTGGRPKGIDPMIANDFPNENGLNNSHPVPGRTAEDDNHHFLTGSTREGTLEGTNTCDSWTTTMTTPTTRPRIGFSFVAGNRRNWINGQIEGGCGAGINIKESGGSDPSNPIVGSGGGYGGIYCFALQP
jgi:hypothetical protein